MVKKTYICDICGASGFNKKLMTKHEKIPVRGEGYHGLILQEVERTDISVFVVMEEKRELGRLQLDLEHNVLYRIINVYYHSWTKIALREWHSEPTAGAIKEDIRKGEFRKLTEDEFSTYAPEIERKFHPSLKLKRTPQ